MGIFNSKNEPNKSGNTNTLGSFMSSNSLFSARYKNETKLIKDIESLRNFRTVRSIKPQSDNCAETYPCEGHIGALITFENDEMVYYDCGSVDIGIIMYYYGLGSPHFTGYVNNDVRKFLDNLRDESLQI